MREITNSKKTINPKIIKKSTSFFTPNNFDLSYEKFNKKLVSNRLGSDNTIINGNIEAIPAISKNAEIIKNISKYPNPLWSLRDNK